MTRTVYLPARASDQAECAVDLGVFLVVSSPEELAMATRIEQLSAMIAGARRASTPEELAYVEPRVAGWRAEKSDLMERLSRGRCA